MNIQPAKRLDHFQTGIFAALDQKKKNCLKAEKPYIISRSARRIFRSLTISKTLCQKRQKILTSTITRFVICPSCTPAVADYYQRRFDVKISSDEIVAMPGSQEGIAHLGLALCDPGDVVLLPNPGYPVFEVGAYLGGAELYFYDLKEENDFLPRLDEIPEDICKTGQIYDGFLSLQPRLRHCPRFLLHRTYCFCKKT